MRALSATLLLAACSAAPVASQGVEYRDGLAPGDPNSGERGTVRISEVLWSGTVDGEWDPTDVFVEIRNEGNRSMNLSGWQLVLTGARQQTWILPQSDLEVPVGQHVFAAAKTSGCFPEPDWVVPGLSFSSRARARSSCGRRTDCERRRRAPRR